MSTQNDISLIYNNLINLFNNEYFNYTENVTEKYIYKNYVNLDFHKIIDKIYNKKKLFNYEIKLIEKKINKSGNIIHFYILRYNKEKNIISFYSEKKTIFKCKSEKTYILIKNKSSKNSKFYFSITPKRVYLYNNDNKIKSVSINSLINLNLSNNIKDYLFSINYSSCKVKYSEIVKKGDYIIYGSAIDIEDSIYPTIPLKIFNNSNSIKEILSKVFNVNFHSKFLHYLNFIESIKLIKLIHPNDFSLIYQFLEKRNIIFKKFDKNDNSIYPYSLSNQFIYIIRDYFFTKFIINQDINVYSNTFDDYVFHYINLCYNLKMKINLKMCSYKRLISEHDKLSKEIELLKRYERIKQNEFLIQSDIYNFEILNNDNLDIKLICNNDMLYNEANDMKHCVAMYDSLVKKRIYNIYSIIYYEQRYTMSILNETIKIQELRGKYNSAAPIELLNIIENYIESLSNKNQLSA